MRLTVKHVMIMVLMKFESFSKLNQVKAENPTTSPAISQSSLDSTENNCTRVQATPIQKLAYIGWPLSLHCHELSHHLMSLIRSKHYGSYNDDMNYDYHYPLYSTDLSQTEAECQIWDMDRNAMVFRSKFLATSNNLPSYHMSDVLTNQSVNYEIKLVILNDKTCVSSLLHINLTVLPNNTCEEAMRLTSPIKRRIEHGDSAFLICRAPHGSGMQISDNAYKSSTFRWLRNCADVEDQTKAKNNLLNRMGPYREFKIHNASYEHLGVYTCAVTHNKQTWYMVHHKVCIHPPLSTLKPSIRCLHQTVRTKLGKKAVLQCAAILGSAGLSTFHMMISWNHKSGDAVNHTECRNYGGYLNNEAASKNKPTIKCSYSMNSIPCFHQMPTEEERKIHEQKILLNLTIENVGQLDLGEYNVTIGTSSHISHTSVKLALDITSSLMTKSVIVGACIGALLAVIFTTGLITVAVLRRRRKGHRLRREDSSEDTSTITESA